MLLCVTNGKNQTSPSPFCCCFCLLLLLLLLLLHIPCTEIPSSRSNTCRSIASIYTLTSPHSSPLLCGEYNYIRFREHALTRASLNFFSSKDPRKRSDFFSSRCTKQVDDGGLCVIGVVARFCLVCTTSRIMQRRGPSSRQLPSSLCMLSPTLFLRHPPRQRRTDAATPSIFPYTSCPQAGPVQRYL